MIQLGSGSLRKLEKVHPKLVEIVRLAASHCDTDFGVYEGIRTPERQKEYVRTGVSKTMNSKHLLQPDGYGHAVDLVPYIDGTMRWEWGPIYHIAAAMRRAALEAGAEIIWGGVWDRPMSELRATSGGLKIDVNEYQKRHPGPDFLDGPHYQLVVT